jgi:hypothetical protein
MGTSYLRFFTISRILAAHWLIPPWPLMKSVIGVSPPSNASVTRNTRDHLLWVLPSTLPGAEVHRNTTTNGSVRTETVSHCNLKANPADFQAPRCKPR